MSFTLSFSDIVPLRRLTSVSRGEPELGAVSFRFEVMELKVFTLIFTHDYRSLAVHFKQLSAIKETSHEHSSTPELPTRKTPVSERAKCGGIEKTCFSSAVEKRGALRQS